MMRPRTTAARPGIRRIATWGVAWGLLVTLAETLRLPSELWTWEIVGWWMLNWLAPLQCLIGCLFIWTAAHGDRVAGTRGVVMAWLLVSIGAAALYPEATRLARATAIELMPSAAAISRALLGPDGTPSAALAAFHLWLHLFYGGMLVAAFTNAQRRERVSSLLNATVLVRSRSDTLLANARSQALQTRYEAPLVLATLVELKQRYGRSPERAEKLLEALVEYLRRTIPDPHTAAPGGPAATAQARLVAELGCGDDAKNPAHTSMETSP